MVANDSTGQTAGVVEGALLLVAEVGGVPLVDDRVVGLAEQVPVAHGPDLLDC